MPLERCIPPSSFSNPSVLSSLSHAPFFGRCTFILLLREAFPNKGDFLEELKRNPQVSVSLKEYLDFEYKQYVSFEDGWLPKSRPIDVVELLRKRKLNHEVWTLAGHTSLCFPVFCLCSFHLPSSFSYSFYLIL